MHYKLEVDVHAHWNDNAPIYRLYVDNELLTERTFGWVSYQFLVKEHIHCYLETGMHKLVLENLDTTARFELDNFTVNESQIQKNLLRIKDNKIEWNFVIDNLLQNLNNHIEPQAETPNVQQVETVTYPRKVVIQPKKYETYAPLVQRVRELNSKK